MKLQVLSPRLQNLLLTKQPEVLPWQHFGVLHLLWSWSTSRFIRENWHLTLMIKRIWIRPRFYIFNKLCCYEPYWSPLWRFKKIKIQPVMRFIFKYKVCKGNLDGVVLQQFISTLFENNFYKWRIPQTSVCKCNSYKYCIREKNIGSPCKAKFLC